MKKALFALLILVAVIVAVTGYMRLGERRQVPEFATSPAVATDEPYLRAVHWFGGEWAINFWNTNLEARARSDFETIKADGFNTVVLLVPWPGFAPDPRSGELDESRITRLRNLMHLADDMDLKVILRVSYAYDGLDEDQGWRNYELWMDEEHYQAWLDFLQGVWEAVGEMPNLEFGFFSWEDLWAVMRFEQLDPEVRLSAARNSGYVDWLAERYSLEEVSKFYRQEFSAWDEVSIADRREPAFELFLDFVNQAWIERFFIPAQKRFPKLSMEIRIDADPVWDGDELVKWYYHEAAWDLPGAEWIVLYWAPSMGGENQGETLSPETAAERLEWWLERVVANTGPRKIFIGQFLAEDFTPGYENNGRIPHDQVPDFLARAEGVLDRYTAGYGLWTWTDYGHNSIANPEFYVGMAGWQYSEGVENNETGVNLEALEWVGIPLGLKGFHGPNKVEESELCIEGKPLSGQVAHVRVNDTHVDEELGIVEFSDEESVQCIHFSDRDFVRFEIKAMDDVLITRVENIDFVQRSGMRGRDGTLKPVGESYRRLNAALVEQPLVSQPMYEDGWMGEYLLTYLEPAEESSTLRVITHLPDNWPFEPELTVSVNGEIVDRITCTEDSEYSIPVAQDDMDDGPIKISIEASHTHEPQDDSRRLGCLIDTLELVP